MKNIFYILFILAFSTFSTKAQDNAFTEQEEVIYARKHGMALTMVVLKPKKSIGKGIVSVISGNWFSSHASLKRNID